MRSYINFKLKSGIYKGEINELFQRHGRGSMFYIIDQNTIEGEWQEDKFIFPKNFEEIEDKSSKRSTGK